MQKVNIGTYACAVDEDGVLWMSDFHFNGLFKYDILTQKINWIAQFPDVSVGSERLHASAYIYTDAVVFVPMKDTKVRIYIKSENRFISLHVPVGENSTIFYANSILLDNNIYFLSKDFRVWKCDLLNKSVVEDVELSDLCKENLSENEIGISTLQSGFGFWQKESKKGCKLDILSRTLKTFDVEIEKDAQVFFYEKGKYWFLLENSFDVLEWDGKKTIKSYKGEGNEWLNKRKKNPYDIICQVKNELYVLNQYSKYIMKIDEKLKTIERLFIYPSEFKVLKQIGYGTIFSKAYQYKEYVLFVPQRGNMVLFYSKKGNVIKGHDFSIDKREIPYWNRIISERLAVSQGVMEAVGFVELDEYLEALKNVLKRNRDKLDNIGAQIIECLREE